LVILILKTSRGQNGTSDKRTVCRSGGRFSSDFREIEIGKMINKQLMNLRTFVTSTLKKPLPHIPPPTHSGGMSGLANSHLV
jgi:hypothetical protein